MKVLGLSSAIGIIGAGIADESGIAAECSFSSIGTRSEKLIPIIDDVLNKSKMDIKDMDAVAVTTGPGSYSGLRGGLATAKALVAVLGIPVISVSTLHAIAFNFVDTEGTVAVIVNACRDDYNVALFASCGGKLKRLTGDITAKLASIEEVISSVQGRLVLAADGKLVKTIKNKNISLADPSNTVPWAINVARIGLTKLKNRELDDHIRIVPAYSHKPNIREYSR